MYHLKKALMQAILSVKKKKQPFDYEKAEAFTLPKGGDGTFNNSYYFSAHSKEKEESLYVRLGLRDDDSAEAWVFYTQGEKRFYLQKMLYTAESSPLKVTREKRGWRFSFEGVLTDEKGEDVSASLSCIFQSSLPVVDFFQHMPTARTATAIAQEKWQSGFFDEVQKNNSVHYEQEGLLTGKLTLAGEERDIVLPCLRDHSYGRRVWGYMNNHLWLAAVDNGCALNFSMVSYPSISVLEVGHLHLGNNPVQFVTKASYDRNQIVQNAVPETLALSLTISNGRVLPVKAKLLHYQPYVFEEGAYTLNEGIAEFEVNGVLCRGILEIGFNRDSSRFMNGKSIAEIRE